MRSDVAQRASHSKFTPSASSSPDASSLFSPSAPRTQVIIEKHYTGTTGRSAVEIFWEEVNKRVKRDVRFAAGLLPFPRSFFLLLAPRRGRAAAPDCCARHARARMPLRSRRHLQRGRMTAAAAAAAAAVTARATPPPFPPPPLRALSVPPLAAPLPASAGRAADPRHAQVLPRLHPARRRVRARHGGHRGACARARARALRANSRRVSGAARPRPLLPLVRPSFFFAPRPRRCVSAHSSADGGAVGD